MRIKLLDNSQHPRTVIAGGVAEIETSLAAELHHVEIFGMAIDQKPGIGIIVGNRLHPLPVQLDVIIERDGSKMDNLPGVGFQAGDSIVSGPAIVVMLDCIHDRFERFGVEEPFVTPV